MSSVEVFFTWLFVIFRFLWIICLIISPIVFIKCFIKNIVKHTIRKSFLYFLCLMFVPLLFYLTFSNQSVSGKVDKNSITNTQNELLALNVGSYSFDTGYICGDLYIDDDVADMNLMNFEDVKTYQINEDCVCYITDVFCVKDERWYNLFCPTISSGEIIIEFNDRTVYIDYYYNDCNLFSALNFITNPEVIYRRTIQIDDIVSTLR